MVLTLAQAALPAATAGCRHGSTPSQASSSRARSSLRGRPRGRLRGTTAPRSKISPPHTPQGSARSMRAGEALDLQRAAAAKCLRHLQIGRRLGEPQVGVVLAAWQPVSSPTVSARAGAAGGANARVIPVTSSSSLSLLVIL